MKRLVVAVCGLSCLVLMTASSAARALMIAPAPISQRVATSDAVVVGKVTGFADKTVSAPQFPGATDKVEYQVAIVKVEDGLLGAKGVKEIKVGFIPPPPPGGPVGPGGPGGGPIRPGFRRFPQVNLSLGGEYCLFLQKHHSADFYIAPAYFSSIDKKSPEFADAVTEATKCAKLLADPKAGLESKKEGDRLLTAGMLLSRYRQPRGGVAKQEPIPADESKAILTVLADADWTPPKPGPGPFRGFQMTPQNLFFQLGLTPDDEWKQPMKFEDVPEAAKKWLKDHADSYRIKRFVSEEKKTEKKD